MPYTSTPAQSPLRILDLTRTERAHFNPQRLRLCLMAFNVISSSSRVQFPSVVGSLLLVPGRVRCDLPTSGGHLYWNVGTGFLALPEPAHLKAAKRCTQDQNQSRALGVEYQSQSDIGDSSIPALYT